MRVGERETKVADMEKDCFSNPKPGVEPMSGMEFGRSMVPFLDGHAGVSWHEYVPAEAKAVGYRQIFCTGTYKSIVAVQVFENGSGWDADPPVGGGSHPGGSDSCPDRDCHQMEDCRPEHLRSFYEEMPTGLQVEQDCFTMRIHPETF